MKLIKFFATLLSLAGFINFLDGNAIAQLDPTFGTNGLSQINVFSEDSLLKTFALPNGKILVVDASNSFSPPTQYSFVLFNSNGTLDTTYGTNGVAPLNIPFLQPANSYIGAAARQSDGKIVLAGSDGNDGIVLRFNENGTLDPTFANGGIHRPNIDQTTRDYLGALTVQPDGKIVIGGYFNTSTTNFFLLRYETDGSLDPGFGDNGFIIYPNLWLANAGKLVLQSTGQIIVPLSNVSLQAANVYRFNANGSLDNGFSQIPYDADAARDILVQPDDKILISDSITKNDTLERVHYDTRIARYNANGTADQGFGVNGKSSVDIASYFGDSAGTLGLLSDGQIVVSAITYITANRSAIRGQYYSLVRFSQTGAVNGKYLVADTVNFTPPQTLILPDNKIVGVTTKSLGFNVADLFLAKVTNVPLQNYRFRANPFDFGSSDSFVVQDGRADVTVFRENQSNWYINPLSNPFFFGLPGDIPIPGDFIKDYGVELAIFRPSTGTWYIGRDFQTPGQNFITLPFGLAGDIPIPFDHDGDSKADISVFRPSEGNWYIRNSHDNSVSILRWGTNGDKPVPGDFDGDGQDDVAVWRPSTGVWYILRSSDGQPQYINFGSPGDIPVQEDYDGDNKTDIAVWRPSTGVWYIWRSSDNSFTYRQWGLPDDIPTPSDFDGDFKTDISVWRPGNRTWYIFQSGTNSSAIFPYGLNNDVPVQRRN